MPEPWSTVMMVSNDAFLQKQVHLLLLALEGHQHKEELICSHCANYVSVLYDLAGNISFLLP